MTSRGIVRERDVHHSVTLILSASPQQTNVGWRSETTGMYSLARRPAPLNPLSARRGMAQKVPSDRLNLVVRSNDARRLNAEDRGQKASDYKRPHNAS